MAPEDWIVINQRVTCHFDFQAGPSDPKQFPFILVGNKVDLDAGSRRVVSYLNESLVSALQEIYLPTVNPSGSWEESKRLVRLQGRHSVFRNIREGGPQCRHCFSMHCEAGVGAWARSRHVRCLLSYWCNGIFRLSSGHAEPRSLPLLSTVIH